MPDQPDDAALDARIDDLLAGRTDEQWAGLWAALDALDGQDRYATWAGGEVVGTSVVAGEARPVQRMPYPEYTEEVERLRWFLGGLVVPFDWMGWDGLARYRDDPAALAGAPVGDAVRLVTAVVRSERFSEGSIEGALRSGVLQAALARLRVWFEGERVGG